VVLPTGRQAAPSRRPRGLRADDDRARRWDIDTGHDLMITEPQMVVDALLQIAGS
jgi:hypothetical protein